MANPKRAKKAPGNSDENEPSSAALDEEQEMLSGDEDIDDDDSDSGDGENSDSEDNSEKNFVNDVVNVDFEAFPPDDSDFHGIKKLLQQLFRNAHVNLSDLANQLIELNKLSVILRQADEEMADEDEEDDDDDVFGITGIIPLGGEREGAKSVREFLLEKAATAKDASIRKKLETLFVSGSIGLFVSERFINIPPRVALPLLESILKDWTEVKKSISSLSKVHHFIMVCKLYTGEKEVIYANGEEELFVDLAEIQFDFEVPQQDADSALAGKWKKSDEELKQIRKVLLMDIKKLPQMIQLVKDNV